MPSTPEQPTHLPTAEDISRADEIAWSMALEGRKLTDAGYAQLLKEIISERLAEQGNSPTG